MRIHILSDLHLEFAPFDPPETNADVVLLAGDIHTGLHGVEWAATAFAGRPVLYISGNHEFYGRNAPDLIGKLRERGRELGVTVLSDEQIVIGGVRFLCATLWTDFALHGDSNVGMIAAGEQMLDYRKIRLSPTYRKLRPQDTLLWHHVSRKWLEARLAEPCDLPTIIATHHAPSLQSIPERFLQQDLSAAFASNLDPLVSTSGAVFWIHGHTHHNIDYMIGGTRVISNQRGYLHEAVAGFEPDRVLTAT